MHRGPTLRNSTGCGGFPINPAYKVEATFTTYADKVARVPDTLGGTRELPVSGFVFILDDRKLRIDFYAASPDYLFTMFKDGTSGHESYGAGRYLTIDTPKNGKAIVDFNKAYNPE